jgi:hypothetical protein
MSIYDKSIKNVAEAAAKIMAEKLHPNQQKLDVHEPEKDKLTSKDFEMLRAGKKAKMKEDVEQINELKKSTLGSYVKKATSDVIDKKDQAHGEHEYGSPFKGNKLDDKAEKRVAGVHKAVSRLAKEDVEQINELKKSTLGSYVKKASQDAVNKATDAAAEAEYGTMKKSDEYEKKSEKRLAGVSKAATKLAKEEVELQEMEDMIDALILEYESKGGVYKHKGTYGTAKGAEYGETDYKKENELAKATEKPAKKKYGARQNYVRSTRVNESFTGLLEKYTEGGVKSLNESLYTLEESVDNEQFNTELEKSKRKNAGEDRNDKNIAAGSVQAVKNEETHKQVSVIDMTDPNNITKSTIDLDERQMSEPEMKERERIVKGMKKGLAGFKQRYGERAKSVMYATAAKIAKEKA